LFLFQLDFASDFIVITSSSSLVTLYLTFSRKVKVEVKN
jgi:hypothetical protein